MADWSNITVSRMFVLCATSPGSILRSTYDPLSTTEVISGIETRVSPEDMYMWLQNR